MKENARTILEKYHIVTTTYSSKETFINVWTEKENKAAVGFKAGVTGVGEIGPSTEFYLADAASSWNKFSVRPQSSSAFAMAESSLIYTLLSC